MLLRILALSVAVWTLAACGDDTKPPPVSVKGYQDVSVQHYGERVCALTLADEVRCWGKSLEFGNTSPPEAQFTKVLVGGFMDCGRRVDGAVECWGPIDETTRENRGWSKFSVSDVPQVCGITPEGIECPYSEAIYSEPSWVESGKPFRDAAIQIRDEAPRGDFIDISSSWSHSCAVARDGKVRCWGRLVDRFPEKYTPPDVGLSRVVVGNNFTCGLTRESTVVCSDNFALLLGDTKYSEISAGFNQVCLVRQADQRVECYGSSAWGENEVPDVAFRAISAGPTNCGLTLDDGVLCWGGRDVFNQTTVPEP